MQTRLLLGGCAVFALACGGTTTGDDGGADAANDSATDLDGFVTGCGQFTTNHFDVDASACVPQLSSATSCQGEVCSWTVELPCTDDAGSDAGDCNVWCSVAAPPNVGPSSFCQPFTEDGGTFASCGGCGI